MTEIVGRWLQERLGLLMTMAPEIFADKVKDGYLLSTIFRNYEIITEEQLEMIEKSDSPEICMTNFKDHILIWLQNLDINVDEDELYQIVNAKGTAALNLFYQVYLELHTKNKLHFIVQNRVREKLRRECKFKVEKAEESKIPIVDDSRAKKYDYPLKQAKDIIHWQKDRLQMLQTKCKEAREEYLQYVRLRQPAVPRISNASRITKIDTSKAEHTVENIEPELIDMSYEQLINEQDEAKQAQKFIPDTEESRRLLKKLRVKKMQHSENIILKKELAHDLFTSLWDRQKKDEEDSFNDNIVEALMKRSLYERQIHQKLEEVKLQKHFMLENKRNEVNDISKQMDADFVQRITIRDKEMDEKEITYYLEKERILELHKTLYERKLQKKTEISSKMCKEAVTDLVDLACNISDYTMQVGEDPPRRVMCAWKDMFIAGIPFNNFVAPIETILKNPEELSEEVEDIVHLEIDRQERMDKNDLATYMAFEWPWSLDNIDVEEYNMDDMTRALNILGNLVHNLLAIKYPYPPLPPKPDFPNITVSACINGLDTNCLPVLEEILNLKEILVVQMQDCINYCVNAYIEETTVEVADTDIDVVYDKRKKKSKEKGGEKSEKKSKKGSKSKGKGSKRDEEIIAMETRLVLVDKMIQTPSYYPDEEIPLTAKGELGKVAQEVLKAGEPLTSHILVAMFIEYLKSKPNIKGWVLINYPKTYEEAAVLEEGLTGLPVPGLGQQAVETCQSIFEMGDLEQKPSILKELDKNGMLRLSKILPQPVAKIEPEFYDTALTAYIRAIKRGGERDKRGRDSHPNLEEVADICDPLDNFYTDLGCNYQFYYNRIDFNATKYLAKLIVGDYSLPPKTSVELFGEQINYIRQEKDIPEKDSATATKTGDKKQRPKEKKTKLSKSDTMVIEKHVEKKSTKKSKTSLKAEKGKKKGKGKGKSSEMVVIILVNKYTQAPEPEEEEEEEEVEVEIGEADLPKPGESGWTYVSLPIPEDLQIAMATLWENAEDVYIVDLEQIFFLKRLLLNAAMPFVNSVKQHMSDYVDRPDEKQKHLREFQKIYNEFDDDFRAEDDFKTEMHCRINQMKEKLVEICDWKMIAAEHERVFLIERNWTPRQLMECVNNYITGFQLELDRFTDTMMLIGDYYTAIVTQMPNEIVIPKETLSKLESEDARNTEAINSLLQHVDDSQEVVLHNFVDEALKKSLNFVETAKTLTYSAMKIIKELFKTDSEIKPKSEKSEKNFHREKKSGKGGNHKSSYLSSDFELDEKVLEMSSQILEEWECAIRGEVMRVKVRLEQLKEDLFRNMEEVLGTIRSTFYAIYHEIRTSHEKELSSINNACNILGLAVERQLKIQEELVLDKLEFYVNPEVILFPDKLPTVKPLAESIRTGVFTINQLDKLVDILLDLSPSGYMPERSFSFLLQDLIVNRDDPILVPELWRKLQPRHIDIISKRLFDDIEYIQWKDFILDNLVISFPTEKQILKLRKAFRKLDPDCTELITDYQYMEIKFWFEPTQDDRYRLRLMRQLIFKLYRVKTDQLNYTALLLDFCKDANPVVGLAKALGVYLGKAVCWEIEAGERFVEMSRRKTIYDELVLKRREDLEGGEEMVEEIIEQLIDSIIDICEKAEGSFESIEEIDNSNTANEIFESSKKEEPSSFSNIAHEVEPVADLVYFLPLEALVTVITTCLPWHARVQNMEDRSFREITEDIYEECKNSEFDYKVLSHEFLNHTRFLELIGRTRKFSVKNPVLVVEETLQDIQVDQAQPKSKQL